MRISDWSSDVCSSDLPEDRLGEGVADDGDGVHALGLDLVEQLRGIEVPGWEQDDAAAGREHREAGEGTGAVHRSEESRVGKEWSVRVNLGCRRIIQKNSY